MPRAEPQLLEQKRALEEQGFAVEVAIATGIPAAERDVAVTRGSEAPHPEVRS